MLRILIATYLLIISSFSHGAALADDLPQHQLLEVDVEIHQVVDNYQPLTNLTIDHFEELQSGSEYAKSRYQIERTIVDKLKRYQQKVQRLLYHQKSISEQLTSAKPYLIYIIQAFEPKAESFVS